MAVVEISGISPALSAADFAGSFAISLSSVSACLSSVTMHTANILLFSAVLSLDYVLQKASSRLT